MTIETGQAVTANPLTHESYRILRAVNAAMQDAEEIGGPTDYAELMDAIIREATTRKAAYLATKGGK